MQVPLCCEYACVRRPRCWQACGARERGAHDIPCILHPTPAHAARAHLGQQQVQQRPQLAQLVLQGRPCARGAAPVTACRPATAGVPRGNGAQQTRSRPLATPARAPLRRGRSQRTRYAADQSARRRPGLGSRGAAGDAHFGLRVGQGGGRGAPVSSRRREVMKRSRSLASLDSRSFMRCASSITMYFHSTCAGRVG